MSAFTETAAELRGAVVRFGATQALRGIDLTIATNQVTVLLGPNGAGKTTAIRLLLGAIAPNAGTARVFGCDPREPRHRQRTGAMLQVSKVPELLTVSEHIDTFRSYYAAPLSRAELLHLAGLEHLANRRFGQLSGGEKQRVLFALALAGDPRLLFLDEPTVGMDVSARRSFWNTVRALRADGRAILLTTHQLEEADAIADRVVVLDHGAVLAEGTPGHIKRLVSRQQIRCSTSLHPDRIRALGMVDSVVRDADRTLITTASAEDVLRVMLLEDLELKDLEVRTAGLEDAYLALTHATSEAA